MIRSCAKTQPKKKSSHIRSKKMISIWHTFWITALSATSKLAIICSIFYSFSWSTFRRKHKSYWMFSFVNHRARINQTPNSVGRPSRSNKFNRICCFGISLLHNVSRVVRMVCALCLATATSLSYRYRLSWQHKPNVRRPIGCHRFALKCDCFFFIYFFNTLFVW